MTSLKQPNQEEAIQFLQELLRVNSINPPGNEHHVTEILAQRAQKVGFRPHVTKITENRSNLEITWQGMGSKTLLLCGHMDTVSPGEQEWQYPPFSGERVAGRLYGRGASDMKSGLAAVSGYGISSSRRFVPNGEIHFLATAGEEVDCCGALRYLADHPQANWDAIIIGEPTKEKVVIGHKGALWLEITTYGKTAHGAMPEHGINAIEQMSKLLPILKQFDLQWKVSEKTLGSSSLAVTKIAGGVQTNVIPDQCFIHVDLRTVPPLQHQELVKELKTKLTAIREQEEDFRAEIKVLLDRPGVLTDPTASIIQHALSLKQQEEQDCFGVPYYTDASVLNSNSNIPTLIYGPGDEKLAHQPNEWVEIAAYLRCITFYKELIKKFFS